eukprot:342810-Rhodomonas_salina.1
MKAVPPLSSAAAGAVRGGGGGRGGRGAPPGRPALPPRTRPPASTPAPRTWGSPLSSARCPPTHRTLSPQPHMRALVSVGGGERAVSYTHLRAHETEADL